jgi:glycosyltransferase involved in cell wall biosynthesis
VVVANALNAVFLRAIASLPDDTPAKAQIGSKARDEKKITLGFVGRAYSHKNIDVLPGVRRALRERYGVDAAIKVTLNDDEWAAQTQEFRSEIENSGSMSLKDLVEFYRSVDGVVFPSLLECFSVTPLEAMAMGLPLYASDRAFVRDSCGDLPFYFDPLDPVSIADAVGRSLALSGDVLAARLRASRVHVLSLPTATERAKKMIELLFSF